jgi:hypothetical protein
MQDGHRGALPGHILVGAIIGGDALQNKGKKRRPVRTLADLANVGSAGRYSTSAFDPEADIAAVAMTGPY